MTLQGKVAVVAGATRGAGRGIACMLGEAGRDGLLHRAQFARRPPHPRRRRRPWPV